MWICDFCDFTFHFVTYVTCDIACQCVLISDIVTFVTLLMYYNVTYSVTWINLSSAAPF